MSEYQSRLDGIVSGDTDGMIDVFGYNSKTPQSRLEKQITEIMTEIADIKDLATSGIHYKASVAFDDIPTSGMQEGDLYDINEDFTTDSRFSEGAGIECLAGTDIVYNSNGKWNLFANSAISAIRSLQTQVNELIDKKSYDFQHNQTISVPTTWALNFATLSKRFPSAGLWLVTFVICINLTNTDYQLVFNMGENFRVCNKGPTYYYNHNTVTALVLVGENQAITIDGNASQAANVDLYIRGIKL